MNAPEELAAALSLFIEKMDRFGEWDEGCYYYQGHSATELQEAIKDGRVAMARWKKECFKYE